MISCPDDPVITVGISFRNNCDTLAAAVRSVFAQRLGSWELILVADGSTDGSEEIVKSIDDPRVRLVTHGRCAGLASRLNEIASRATTPFLARMDADDLMHPERLNQQLQYLRARPHVDVVGTAMYAIDRSNSVLGVRGLEPLDLRPASVLRHGALCHPTIVGRTAWFRRYPYDTLLSRSQDRDLWCRSFLESCLAHLPQPLHYYRETRIDISKYLLSQRMNRKIYCHHGRRLVGRLGLSRVLAESVIKSVVVALASPSLQRRISRRRNSQLTLAERKKSEDDLRATLTIHVPGLPDAR